MTGSRDARREPTLSWKGGLALAAFGVLLALGTAEAALRAFRFHFDLVPSLQFGWPDPQALRDAYAPDPDLVWVTRDYREVLRTARRLHPAIVFMGDSCTEFGTYPSRTLAKLQAAGSPLATGVKLGVGGWSSEQGLIQLRRDVISLHPRVITVYYGWNDHWVAMGLTDPEIARAHALREFASHSRLAQLWLKIEVGMAARRTPPPNRVPLRTYADNLVRIATEARAAGITPVFVTAPSNHTVGREPAYLATRHLRALSELVPLHTAYVDETRRIARQTVTPLCDAASAFAQLPAPHDRYFRADGIHLTDAGDEEMAGVLSACLVELKLLPDVRFQGR